MQAQTLCSKSFLFTKGMMSKKFWRFKRRLPLIPSHSRSPSKIQRWILNLRLGMRSSLKQRQTKHKPSGRPMRPVKTPKLSAFKRVVAQVSSSNSTHQTCNSSSTSLMTTLRLMRTTWTQFRRRIAVYLLTATGQMSPASNRLTSNQMTAQIHPQISLFQARTKQPSRHTKFALRTLSTKMSENNFWGSKQRLKKTNFSVESTCSTRKS